MTTIAAESALRAPETSAPRAVEKRYFCPACRRATLALVLGGGPHVARCDACDWATDDLLALIPTRPTSVAEVALGSGTDAALRAIAFFAACAGVLALLLVGR